MRTNLLTTLPLASAAALALAASVPAGAQAPAAAAAAPAPPKIQYSGLFDGYYAYDFNNPNSTVAGSIYPANTIGRYYDERHNTPTLALGELNVFLTPNPGNFGFKATLGAGDTAELNGGAAFGGAAPSTNEGQFKSLLQAYGTYGLQKGAGIDFGKFYTPIGYELTESNGNFNETHSVPFSFIPFYHFGVRAYTPSYNGFVLTGYVVNAVYNAPATGNVGGAGVENNTGTASFVGNVIWTDPKGKWVIGDSLGIGKNKYNLVAGPDPTRNKVTVNDTDVTYNFDPKNIGGLDYTYAQTNPDNNTSGSFKATDNAWAVYWKHVLTPKSDVAFRYSGGQFKSDAPGSSDPKPWEATATYEMHPASNFLWRLEYQHAGASNPIFVDSSETLTKKQQDVVEVAGIFSFSG